MSNFSDGWQDRAFLYMRELTDISREKTKLIFVRLCEYALKNDMWVDGKLTLDLTVDDMTKICGATRSSVITALVTLNKCGAITRKDTHKWCGITTIINSADDCVLDSIQEKTKLIFSRLCEYASKNDMWVDGKLTLKLTVNDMTKICGATRYSIYEALNTLIECGAITRKNTKMRYGTTIINFTDD